MNRSDNLCRRNMAEEHLCVWHTDTRSEVVCSEVRPECARHQVMRRRISASKLLDPKPVTEIRIAGACEPTIERVQVCAVGREIDSIPATAREFDGAVADAWCGNDDHEQVVHAPRAARVVLILREPRRDAQTIARSDARFFTVVGPQVRSLELDECFSVRLPFT